MNYKASNNRLAKWYYNQIRRTLEKGNPIYHEWTTWRGFAKWCESQGYDENTVLYYSCNNPFAPKYVTASRYDEGDFEYIVYAADDPYELIITSASSVAELVERLHRLGYDYDAKSISTAICHNETLYPIEERERGLVFEKIDLSNYEDYEIPEGWN